MRIAAQSAVLASPHLGLGILPGLGGGQRLIRLCGVGRARCHILSGDRINAESAQALGLVEQVVPESELWETTLGMARRLASKSRIATGLAKKALNYAAHARLAAGCANEAALFGVACAAADGSALSVLPGDGARCA